MVRAPDVDHAVEAALDELVVVVGDVRGEVGRLPVRADQHVVLGLPELRGGEPDRALALDDVALLAQQREHAVVGAALDLQRALGEPAVVAHAHRLEVLADLLDHEPDALVAEAGVGLLARGAQEGVAVVALDALGDLADVLAGVAVLRDLGVAAEDLLVAGVEGAREDRDLLAGVVDVVLLLHLVPGRAQHGGERGADGGAAPVADVDRPGRVGGDVLDLRLAAAAEVELRPVLAGLGDRARLAGGPAGVEVEVEEARRGDAHLAYGRMRGHARAQRLGDVERAHAGEALDAQRQVGGEVAVLGSLGVFECDLGRGERGQVARLLRGDERPFDQFPQLFRESRPAQSIAQRAGREGRRRRQAAPGGAVARWRYTRSMSTNEKLLHPFGFLASLRRIVLRPPASAGESVAGAGVAAAPP